jgi:NAD(P)-dependent dehydrogenase (short-subunit alcohol dehydrogenase family)
MARVALVTGGMGGLGEAVCFKLSALGYCVVTTYSPGNPKVEQWLATTRDQGFNFRAYPCDVADYDSAQACVAAIEKDIGPIDVLVNNAGITRDMTFKKMDKPNWDAVMATNLDSVFNMTKPVCDGMVERGAVPAHPPEPPRHAGGRRGPHDLLGRGRQPERDPGDLPARRPGRRPVAAAPPLLRSRAPTA